MPPLPWRIFTYPTREGERVQDYADTKQTVLEQLAAQGAVRTYDDAITFLLTVKAAGGRVCAASSSKNANGFLRSVPVAPFTARSGQHYAFVHDTTTLLDLFDANVNGRAVPHGKPDPAIFLAAADALGLPPECCFVVEDASAGVAAARAGGMYAIGVARHDDAAALHAEGADIVTTRLDTLDIAALLSNATGADNA